MGQTTDIEWASSTVNPTTGCDGCELWKANIDGPCYAGNYHETRMAKALPSLYAANFAEVRLAPGRMAKAAAWSDQRGKIKPFDWMPMEYPRLIFVGDMGDVFSKAIPFEYLHDEIVAVADSPKGRRHIWMLLTKQPSRMASFGEWLTNRGIRWPDNLWAGTSITSRATIKRAEHLKRVPAKIRYLSLEPLWERLDLTETLGICWRCRGKTTFDSGECGNCGGSHGKSGIGWVIVGGQSDQGPHQAKPFDIDWARDVIEQCRVVNVPCFVKQMGSRPFVTVHEENNTSQDTGRRVNAALKDYHGGDWSEWNPDLRVRQFPSLEAIQ